MHTSAPVPVASVVVSRTAYRLTTDGPAVLALVVPCHEAGGRDGVLDRAARIGLVRGHDDDVLEVPEITASIRVRVQRGGVLVNALRENSCIRLFAPVIPPAAWFDSALDQDVLLVIGSDDMELPECDIEAVEVLIEAAIQGEAALGVAAVVDDRGLVDTSSG